MTTYQEQHPISVHRAFCNETVPLTDASTGPRKKLRSSSPPSKTVRFSNEIYKVQSRQLTEEELRGSWFQPSEYQKIRTDNALTILALQKSKGKISLLDSDHFSVRGLERAITTFVYKMNMNSQRKVTQSVVRLYHAQRQLGISNPDEIRTMSMQLTEHDRSRALEAARVDASS